MRVLVTGASGLVGHHLLPALLAAGHTPVALSRDPAAHPWPAGTEAVAWDARGPIPDVRADAVVNLAGERVVGKRWTKAHKQVLWESRINTTRHVADWMRRNGCRTLLQASAAGYYGDLPEGPCPESRPPGDGFLADLCVAWEAAARQAPGRVTRLRFGHVLARDGGYLAELLPFAKVGLAGPLAGGRQPSPWVHVEDTVGVVLWALAGTASGPLNVAAPGHAQQRDLARAVARALHRPFQLRVPGLALRLRFGGGAGPALLGGQHLVPERLLANGYQFQHTGLQTAVDDLLRTPR